MVVRLRGKVVVHEQTSSESDSQFSPERHVSCSQLSLAAFSSGRATVSQGPLGMGSDIAAGYMALKSKYEIQLTGSSEL